MMIPSDRTTARRIARVILAGATVLLAQQGAAASGDDGVHQFFSAIFGGGTAQPAAPPAPVQNQGSGKAAYRLHGRPVHDHPLTVRLHRMKPMVAVAQRPTKPGKVSIFDDGTLRPGDAVMTASGIRIFAGSGALPHASSDFVGLTASRHLTKDLAKVLAEVDRLPPG